MEHCWTFPASTIKDKAVHPPGSILIRRHSPPPTVAPLAPGAHQGLHELAQLQARHPAAFTCADIREHPAPLDPETRVLKDVDMGEWFIAPAKAGHAIGTWGVASCVAVCFRGQDGMGNPMMALAHCVWAQDFHDFVDALQEAGIARGQIYLVGGALDRNPASADSLGNLSEMLNAFAGNSIAAPLHLELVGARAGLSQRDLEPDDDPAQLPDLGRPESISVVITPEAVLYRHDALDPQDDPFFNAG